ncbi:hypothetical protein OHAE_3299 [Ochrobactrum soli]|uniref:Uncharacterized protein n=1 Tax=Ochrobactrum soli TaxID=2448455 RepID=A0A2P9HGX4_9HYPH|nr:hypothetical protein OHAE_3299 [[Ochrobactrum] soli]
MKAFDLIKHGDLSCCVAARYNDRNASGYIDNHTQIVSRSNTIGFPCQ